MADKTKESIISSQNRRVQHVFDRIAPTYEFMEYTTIQRAKYIQKYLPESGTILDVGVGSGELAKAYLNGQKLVGMDISKEMLKRAKKCLQGVKLVIGDGEHMPFDDDSFDCLVASETLYYIANVKNFMREARRVLKTGGRLILISRNHFWHRFDKIRRFLRLGPTDGLVEHLYYPEELESILTTNGFKSVTVDNFCVVPLSGLEILDKTPLRRYAHISLATGVILS